MIFKAVRLFLGLILAFGAFGCSEFLKGKPKKQETIEVRKESLSCLKDVSQKFRDFLKSETSEQEIDKVFTCLDSTLNEFQSRVEGRIDAQSFTSEELFQIFDTFIKDSQVSQDATKDLLLLKTAVLGGSAEKITKKEIGDLRQYLGLLKTEAKLLVPYARIFKFEKQEATFSKKTLTEGFAQLNSSLKVLLKASQVYRSDYQFTDLQRLLTNLHLLDSDQSDLIGLAQKVKNLLVGPQALNTEADYNGFVDNLTEVLHLYSFQLQGFVKFEIEDPDRLDDTIAYAESWLSLLQNSLQFQRNKIISVQSLDPVLNEIADRGLIPISVKTETLLSFYKLLIIRAFDSGNVGDPNSFAGLTHLHFLNIQREVAVLKASLRFISDVAHPEKLKVTGKDRISIAAIQEQLKSYDVTQQAQFEKLDPALKKSVTTAFEEYRTEFLSERPSVYRFKKVVIAANQDIWDQNWQDLARAAYSKTLSRELLIGWGNAFSTKLVLKSYLTEAQLAQWYSDFKQFGIEVKTFDRRSENSGPVSFKQANLLTNNGNGDDKMDYFETVQFLNMLIAGGGQTLAEIQAGAQRANCQLPEKDVFDNNWLIESCVVSDLRKNFKNYFSNLSYLVTYTSKLNDDQFFEFYSALMDVTRIDPKLKGQRLETADLRTMSILLHYIETLYARFDADRNFNFSSAEIRTAYPRFKNFATKFAFDNAKDQIDKFSGLLASTVGGYGCFKQEDLIRESFLFLVYNGHAPSQSDLNAFPCFRNKPLIDFSGEVDRKRIINTFKILKTVLGS